MRIDRDELHTMIEKAGFSCGKNTAMVDVFDRFAQLVFEKCETKPIAKPSVKIDKAPSSSLPPPVASQSPSLPLEPPAIANKILIKD